MVELGTRLVIERAGTVTLRLQLARRSSIPTGVVLQEKTSNSHELLQSKAVVVLCQEDAESVVLYER
jgi:hypothetical protein